VSERLSLEELQELEKLLLILEFAQANSPTPVVAPEPPAQTVNSQEKQSKPEAAAIEADRRHFIDRICPEGSTKPSGKMLGKDSWMG